MQIRIAIMTICVIIDPTKRVHWQANQKSESYLFDYHNAFVYIKDILWSTEKKN